jgi:hypothetical protein
MLCLSDLDLLDDSNTREIAEPCANGNGNGPRAFVRGAAASSGSVSVEANGNGNGRLQAAAPEVEGAHQGGKPQQTSSDGRSLVPVEPREPQSVALE